MKLVLMACIFFAGVYCGLYVNPESELLNVLEQLQGLVSGEGDW